MSPPQHHKNSQPDDKQCQPLSPQSSSKKGTPDSSKPCLTLKAIEDTHQGTSPLPESPKWVKCGRAEPDIVTLPGMTHGEALELFLPEYYHRMLAKRARTNFNSEGSKDSHQAAASSRDINCANQSSNGQRIFAQDLHIDAKSAPRG